MNTESEGISREILAKNIKSRRKILGLSQEKLAEAAGISCHTVNSIEVRRIWVSDRTLESIAKVLQVEVYQLFLPRSTTEPPLMSAEKKLLELQKSKRLYDRNFEAIMARQ
jgi:transcriptional regulator with XRE-family HTH domain